MPEQIQNIINRIKEWWTALELKQKVMLITAAAVIVAAIGILGFVVTRPQMTTLTRADNFEQASKIRGLLEGEGIAYTLGDDGLTFTINQKDWANAQILLGTNDIPSEGYSINDVVTGSFSTTEADKQKLYKAYLESKFEAALASLSNVSSAQVTLYIPKDDGTLIANQEESYAGIILDLSDNMEADQAAGLAKYIATELGNDSTANITILDSNGNTLFAGGDEATSAGIASTNQAVKRDAEANVVSKVRHILAGNNLGSALYDDVEIGVNLAMDFSNKESVDYHYYVDEGKDEGYLDSYSVATTENVNGVAGTPGTDSNDDTTYVIEDNGYSTSNTNEENFDYLPSETITTQKGEVGAVDYANSSLSLIAKNIIVYNEDVLKANGELEDITFEQYQEQNSDFVRTEVDEDLYQAISRATGIPVENISIMSYDVPMFQESEGGRDLMDYLQIVLAVLILAMLGFVVFRSLRREQEEEVAEEVSVETLLQAQQDENLEEIGFTDKSEARLLIEKFVEENPEAVAALLRNWLNEDWGE